jgi:hypothetical protein
VISWCLLIQQFLILAITGSITIYLSAVRQFLYLYWCYDNEVLGYGLRSLGFESQKGQEIFLFSETSQPALQPTQPHSRWVPAFIPRDVVVTTHLQLAPRLRMSGAIPLFPYMPLLCGEGHLYHFIMTLYFVWLCPPIRWFNPQTHLTKTYLIFVQHLQCWLVGPCWITQLHYYNTNQQSCVQHSVSFSLLSRQYFTCTVYSDGQAVSVHAMGEVEGELLSFLTSTVDTGGWSALPRQECPVPTEGVATWASIDTQTLWTKEKPLATAGNQSTIPWLSSAYCSHHTMNYATLVPTDRAFCCLDKNIHNNLDT